LSYVIQSAEECGAPHRRTRWFALAIRNTSPDALPLIDTNRLRHDWVREPCDRIIPCGTLDERKVTKQRCAALGNSVVPIAVARAWNTMCRQSYKFTNDSRWPRNVTLALLDPIQHTSQSFPTPAFCYWNQYRKFTDRATRVFCNFLYTEQKTYQQLRKLKRIGALSLLPDRFHVDKVATVNPEFVEWMMGYPAGWTETGHAKPS